MNVIFSQFSSPTFNLAAEEYLFSKVENDYLLLYVNDPSVILGSNQAVVNEIDQDFCSKYNICIVRRMSGGGAVYHDTGNLNYSFIQGKSGEPLSARFLNPVVEALQQLDIQVEIGKRKDLWLDGYKISGTASHLSRGREIHHGTLLYDTDIAMLLKALNPEKRDLVSKATASVPSPVKNIRSYLEKIGVNREATQFFHQFAQQIATLLGSDHISSFNNQDIEQIEILQRDKYMQRAWNYRL